MANVKLSNFFIQFFHYMNYHKKKKKIIYKHTENSVEL